jgi:hypothetical protein
VVAVGEQHQQIGLITIQELEVLQDHRSLILVEVLQEEPVVVVAVQEELEVHLQELVVPAELEYKFQQLLEIHLLHMELLAQILVDFILAAVVVVDMVNQHQREGLVEQVVVEQAKVGLVVVL